MSVPELSVTVHDDPKAARFLASVGDAPAGFATYRRTETTFALRHTEVDPAFDGRGVGSALARTALDSIRAADLDLLPFCPFIAGYLRKHPEYLDLVPADQRARFDLPLAPP